MGLIDAMSLIKSVVREKECCSPVANRSTKRY